MKSAKHKIGRRRALTEQTEADVPVGGRQSHVGLRAKSATSARSAESECTHSLMFPTLDLSM